MIEENARVVGLDDGYAWVETQRQTTCGACSLNKGCGTSVLAKFFGAKRTRMRVLNTLAAEVGDEVVIGLREHALMQGSLAVYAVPLLAMLVLALLGEGLNARLHITETEGVSILFGLAGLALGFLWLRNYALHTARDVRYQPIIVRRLRTAPSSQYVHASSL